MNFCLSGQKIRQKTCTEYLRVLIEEHLLFKDHINFLKQKLNTENGILAKLSNHLPSDILKKYTTLFLIHIYVMHVRFGNRQQWHTSHDSKSSKQSPQNNKFLGRKTSSAYTETKILNLIITLNNCMLVFDHLNSSLPAIFDDLFKPFKEQHSHNTRGARRYVLNIPIIKTSFYGSRSVQVKSIKHWNNIIEKIHFQLKIS